MPASAKWFRALFLAILWTATVACPFYPAESRIQWLLLATPIWMGAILRVSSFRIEGMVFWKLSAFPALFAAGMALVTRANQFGSPLNWPAISALGLLVSTLATASMLAMSRKRDAVTIVALIIFSIPYGIGVAQYVNMNGEFDPVDSKPARVVSKAPIGRRSTSFNVRVDPLPGKRRQGNVSTPDRTLVESLSRGDKVCIDLYEGTLRVTWYTVRQCP